MPNDAEKKVKWMEAHANPHFILLMCISKPEHIIVKGGKQGRDGA